MDASYGLTGRKKGEKLSASQIVILKCILLDPDIPIKDISRAIIVSP